MPTGKIICCENCKSDKLVIKKDPAFDCMIYICEECEFPGIISRDHMVYRKLKLDKIKKRI